MGSNPSNVPVAEIFSSSSALMKSAACKPMMRKVKARGFSELKSRTVGCSVRSPSAKGHLPSSLRPCRSDERRVGHEWVSTCTSRWCRYHEKKTKIIPTLNNEPKYGKKDT